MKQFIINETSAIIDTLSEIGLKLEKISMIYGITGEDIGDGSECYIVYVTPQLHLINKNGNAEYLSITGDSYSDYDDKIDRDQDVFFECGLDGIYCSDGLIDWLSDDEIKENVLNLMIEIGKSIHYANDKTLKEFDKIVVIQENM